MKIIKLNFSPEFIEKISLSMNEVLYGPGEIIFSENDMDHRIFFVIKGNIECLMQ
jgi:CRP-like cAMP-binding protein